MDDTPPATPGLLEGRTLPPPPQRLVSTMSMPSMTVPSSSLLSSPGLVGGADPELVKKSLRAFAEQGLWRNVYKLSESMKLQALADNPATVDFFLQLKYCRLLALVKMRMFKNAVDEWASSALDQYPGLPYSLRLLGALLPSFTGNHPKAIDNVYAVLDWVRTSMAADDPLFRSRVRSTQLAVVSIMARQRDFLSAVQLLDTLCSAEPGDGALWSHLGLMCIELGDLSRAEAAFSAADPLVDTAHSCMNMGLLRFAQGDHEAALELFGRVITLGDPALQAAATNNRACCLLFTRDLSGAVSALETPLLSARPQAFIDETLVFNLNTLTDLHNERPVEKKQQLVRILTTHADDAFDHSTVTLNVL